MQTREDEVPELIIGEGSFIHPSTIIQGNDKITIGKNCYIGPFCYIRGKLEIGDNCWIGPHCNIHAEGGITVGNDVGVGSAVTMLTGHHSTKGTGPIKNNEVKQKPIEIGDGCDIGVGAIILGGASLGKGIQIGAGLLVPGHAGKVPDGLVIKRDQGTLNIATVSVSRRVVEGPK